MSDDQDRERLKDALAKLLDGELSDEEAASLNQRLMDDPEARELYFEFVALETNLDQALAPPLRQSSSRPSGAGAQQFKRAIGIAVAAAIVVAAILFVTQVSRPEPGLVTARVCENSQWSVNGVANPSGATLRAGARVVLEQGVVELGLPDEVRAVIEGPAALTIVDERTVQLDHGRSYFEVSSVAGRGFTVVTRGQRIVDLGTAFGVDVKNGRDEVELHVFKGSVRVDPSEEAKGETVVAPRAVLLENAKVGQEIAEAPTSFLRELPPGVEVVFEEDFESGMVAGRDYAVLMGPNVVTDLAGNNFLGISNPETWNFSTGHTSTPRLKVRSYFYDSSEGATAVPSLHGDGMLFNDPDRTKLTDGNPGDMAGYRSGTFVGFRDDSDASDPQITFDLGTDCPVRKVLISASTEMTGEPETVWVSASRDGENYSAPIRIVPSYSGLGVVTGVLDLAGWPSARYYRLNFVNQDQWMFLGEVQFVSTAPVSAELGNGGALPPSGQQLSLTSDDESPPRLLSMDPPDDSSDEIRMGSLQMVFDEPVKLGGGRVTIRNFGDLSERQIVVGDPRMVVHDRELRITPELDIPDGKREECVLEGWESQGAISIFNPAGDGTWYRNPALEDEARGWGVVGAMRGPSMVALGMGALDGGIRREVAQIHPNERYIVSMAVGVRDEKGASKRAFLGGTIRLVSGARMLAEYSVKQAPSPPNGIVTVAFAWDSSSLPEGISGGDPLAIEIVPETNTSLEPGYFDIDNVRVTLVQD